MGSFNTIKAEVKSRLDNRTDIDSRLDIWINDAYVDILKRPAFSFYELDAIFTFPTVVTVRDYAVFPADFWFVLGMRDNTTEREITRSHWKVFDRIAHSSGIPTRYARFTNQIYLDPTPNSIITVQVRYRKSVDILSAGSSLIWGREWDELLVVASTVRGFQALKQHDNAKEELMLLASLVSERADAPMLEDMDSEFGIEVRLEE